MSTLSAISDHWWALLAVVGGVVSIGIDLFLFLIAWRLYHWLNRRAEPVSSFEERLLALEQTVQDRGQMLDVLTRAIQEGKR